MTFKEYIQGMNVIFPEDNTYAMLRNFGYSRGALPHLSYVNGLFFITTRLYDSLPAEVVFRKRKELGLTEDILSATGEENGEINLTQPINPFRMTRLIQLWNFIQDYEDLGKGECYLSLPEIAKILFKAIKFYDGKRYHLLAWSIMPNHLHLVIQLIDFMPDMPMENNRRLGDCMCRLKTFTAKKANEILGRVGKPFWQKEYFDRYIRSENHLRNVVKYTVNNPPKNGVYAPYTGTIFDDFC